MNKDIILNAIDANAFSSDDTAAGYVNPTYWNRQVLSFLETKLVVADKAKVYDDLLGQDGASLNVTIDATPTAAVATAESDAVAISAQSHTQVVFTPSEYTKGYQLTDKEARRSFVDQLTNMARKIGYSLALARDTAAVTLIQGGAGNSVVANGVASSAIASSDTIDFDDIIDAMTAIRSDDLVPRYLIVSPGQAGQLMKLPQFARADYAGDNSVFREGLVGKIAGMEVFETTLIAPDSNVTTAFVMAVDQLGESCFGIARKALPTIRTERHERDRKTDIVGVEEWDMKILRANGFCTIQSYE